MREVLISIKKKYCDLIAVGAKTVEVRLNRPKCETPFKCYIYESRGSGKVIGEFICAFVLTAGWYITPKDRAWQDLMDIDSCLTNRELYEYTKGGTFYEWQISNLYIYEEPKELGEFRKIFKGIFGEKSTPITKPPQSWCYIEPRQTAD